MENAALLLARLLMCVLFIWDGWLQLIGPAATQAYFARYGLPLPAVAWVIAVIVDLGGGIAILVGLLTRPTAIVMALWCVAAALIAHTDFANIDVKIHFMKNLAMAGGFLYVAVAGPGRWSLDAARFGRRHRSLFGK